MLSESEVGLLVKAVLPEVDDDDTDQVIAGVLARQRRRRTATLRIAAGIVAVAALGTTATLLVGGSGQTPPKARASPRSSTLPNQVFDGLLPDSVTGLASQSDLIVEGTFVSATDVGSAQLWSVRIDRVLQGSPTTTILVELLDPARGGDAGTPVPNTKQAVLFLRGAGAQVDGTPVYVEAGYWSSMVTVNTDGTLSARPGSTNQFAHEVTDAGTVQGLLDVLNQQ
jgi:hypothetical protein